MKLTIKEIKETKPPYQLKNGGVSYEYKCLVNTGGKDFIAPVQTYKEGLVTVGIILESGVNCDRVEPQEIKYTSKEGEEKSFTKYKVYAKKKETYSKNLGFQKISMEQLLYAVAESEKLVEGSTICTDKQAMFLGLLDIMIDHVEIDTANDTVEKIKEEFKGEEVTPFSDKDIPF